MKPVRLNRRAFLRGVGAGIALPLLDAMVDTRGLLYGTAFAQPMAVPRRLLTFYWPDGTLMADWTPSTADRAPLAGTLTAMLSSLAPVQDGVTVVTGLVNAAARVRPIDPRTGMVTGGDHARGTSCFAVGLPATLTGAGGPSVDQVAAAALGDRTRLRSLPVAADTALGPGAADGLTTAHISNLSWSAANAPVPAERDPHQLFSDLFLSDAGTPAAARLARQRTSILDAVLGDVTRLQARVGATDRTRLDEHLTAVRELEREIAFSTAMTCTAPMDPGTAALAEVQHAQLLIRLQVMALKCDITRFGSFQLRRGGANNPLTFLTPSITAGEHSISHDTSPTGLALMRRITTEFNVPMIAYYAQQLASTPEGAGTLLDNTLVYCSSEIANGSVHNHDNMPVVLIGRAGGVTAGTHRVFMGASVNQMFLTLLQHVGAGATSFGMDGTTPLDLS